MDCKIAPLAPPPTENGADAAADIGCAFIIDCAAMPPRFCGEPRRPGSSYCAPHHARCYLRRGSAAERRSLRRIELLAAVAGRRQGRAAPAPPAAVLWRFERLVRVFLRADRSCIVLSEEDFDAAIAPYPHDEL